MAEDFNIGVFSTNPNSPAELKRQRELAAYESAQNIRRVTETPDEYRLRREREKIEQMEKLRNENTETLMQRLAKIDLANITSKSKIDLEYMINEAESIKFFALFNNYDMNSIDFRRLNRAIKAAELRLKYLKRGEQAGLDNIFVDNYKKEPRDKDLLDKLAGGSARANTDYGAHITPNYFI